MLHKMLCFIHIFTYALLAYLLYDAGAITIDTGRGMHPWIAFPAGFLLFCMALYYSFQLTRTGDAALDATIALMRLDAKLAEHD
jgi:sulfite exporter TauE/SafE